MEDKFEQINEFRVHYKTRGSGPCALLLIHGAVGSTNDFMLQLDEQMGLNGREFTIVAYDMPGFGLSKLSDESKTMKCDPTVEYFELCARIGAQLMAKLGFKTYAVGGWSDGARVASLLAIRHQSRVDALVLWGFLAQSDQQSADAIARTRDTSIWDGTILKNYSSIYGEQEFSDLWHHYVDFTLRMLEDSECEPFDIRSWLKQIKCPTLILSGMNDPIVNYTKHVKPLEMEIYDSEIMQFKDMAHNLHQANPVKFNQVLGTFITGVRA